MEKISVVIPVYNMEKYLEKCIKSVMNQTYKNLEIIIVDDGSTDKSVEIADKLAKTDSRIKVISKKNEGVSKARNVGIDCATGEYIGFVDSDDYVAENMFESLYNLCKKYHADISTESFYEIRKNKIISCANSGKIQLLTREEGQIELLKDSDIQSYPWNKLYKRELFETGIRYPVGKTFEDIATTYLLFDKANRIVRQERPIYYYVRRNDSITEDRNYLNYKSYIDVNLEKFTYLFEKYEGNKRVQSYNAYNFIINMIWMYCLIFSYNIKELEKDFDEIFPFFLELVKNNKEVIDKEMNLLNKAILDMLLLDRHSTRLAIKELYMSERLKREDGESALQI